MGFKQDILEFEKGYEIAVYPYVAEYTGNDSVTFHWHTYFEITLVLSGRGRYFVSGKEYDMEEGDIIIFNNAEPHGWLGMEGNMSLLVAVFLPEAVIDPLSLCADDCLAPFINRGGNFKNRISGKEEYSERIRGIMIEMHRESTVRETGWKRIVRADILRILTLLIRHYQDDTKDEENLREKKLALKRIEKALAYIDDHYSEKLSLKEVAASCYMSPNYFSSYFCRATNMSFSEYVARTRLKKVRHMLQTTDMPVIDVAMMCGFQNMSGFYRLFHKYGQGLPRDLKTQKGIP